MPWLRVDDGVGDHRKTRRLLRAHRNGLGGTAFGLHVLGMAHASKYLTDGVIEDEFVVETLDGMNLRGPIREDVVRALVGGGQWEATEGGCFVVHDYLDHNPSRAEVLARRAKEAARKAAGRKSQSDGSPHD